MRNGWTGGQYGVYRLLLGLYLGVHFAQLIPWGRELFSDRGVLPDAASSPLIRLFPNLLAVADAPAVVTALLIAATAAAVLFAAGYHDRPAALLMWYVLACLHARNPLIANPSLPFVGWLLLAHAALPPAPYLSWAARGRADPDGGWHLPRPIFAAAWTVMAAGYGYSGWTKLVSPSWVDGTALARVLENPLARPTALRELLLALPEGLLRLATWGSLAVELAFIPLALLRRLRPWAWTAMLALHLTLLLLIDFADLTLGMIMLHLFTFDPAWLRPADGGAVDRVFYDGHCGLCHRFVRFLLAEDRDGRAFRFAPLDGPVFRRMVAEDERRDLPDSVVVRTADGRLLVRSAAAIHCARRLGGLWRALATAAALVPRPLRDRAYDAVARIRHRVFKRPPAACPLVPANLRRRFDLGSRPSSREAADHGD
ncbi:MAG: DUF393 domain-containing protein [Acidobacteria bacterium]|nr:MAG: DUF393 domain-containing protein [Acidobacteriota bacterium]